MFSFAKQQFALTAAAGAKPLQEQAQAHIKARVAPHGKAAIIAGLLAIGGAAVLDLIEHTQI